LNLMDFIERTPIPEPWAEGDKIPWNEPAFSERMLAEHLTQDHDAASRRLELIDEQGMWIDSQLLDGRPSKILDLGCGPGLYATRLAYLGHTITGIDFSPASIRYAREQAEKDGLPITFHEADIRTAEYGEGYDLVMLIYGEFNTFKTIDAGLILEKAHRALKPGGMLLLEPQDFTYIYNIRQNPPVWRTNRQGLFSERPHVFLYENFWDSRSSTITTRHWVVDAATAQVSRHIQTTLAYTDTDLEALLNRFGFNDVHFYPSLAPKEDQPRQEFFGLTSVRE
jgi:SAM-dependent methyltransferase